MSAFLKLPALVFVTRCALQLIAMPIEARQIAFLSVRSLLDLIKSGMRDQNCHERWSMQHAEAHAAHGVPRWIPD